MRTDPSTLVWLRQDLRLADHPAFQAAIDRGGPVIPVFIWAPDEEGAWAPGAASRWWLHHSLHSLSHQLAAIGSRLIIRRGPSFDTLRSLARETGAQAVVWSRRYEPDVIARDARVAEALHQQGMAAESFNAALLFEPWTIQNKARRPFQVFTPFWRHCLSFPDPAPPLPTPVSLRAPATWPKSLALDALELLPRIAWDAGLRTTWRPGALNAGHQLNRFVTDSFDAYADRRNRPDLPGTSRLSPHLHFGELSPRQIWAALQAAASVREPSSGGWRQSQFLTEIGWREFAHHLLFHFPRTPTEPLRPEFKGFPWHTDATWLRAWQRGQTGYPIVDAGLRELWHTGWMHNRVRMITASFLVKDLRLNWTAGARWFWDTLVDADLAQNTLGWQWTAGCGADAAPFFRIFNPTSQGLKFDPEGDYVRRWIPELARLSAKWVLQPHVAPAPVLSAAGVRLGENYPMPIVSHAIAREVALEAFAKRNR